MIHSKNYLEEILNTNLFDSSTLESLVTTHKLNKLSLTATPPTHSLLKKKNKNLQDEIDKLKLVEAKKNETYNKINSERLRLAKKYLMLEDSIMGLRNAQYDKEIEELNLKLSNVNKPSYNKLYLVISKGLGVEFTSVGGRKICRIRNKATKSIGEVEIGEDSGFETTNMIWEMM